MVHLAFDKQAEMFPYEEFFWSAVFGVVGGIFSVFLLKLLEDIGAGEREIVGWGYFKRSRKCPQEHDERFC